MATTITIIDSIMGSGKTTAMIQQINRNPDEKYIYIVPYLDEVKRIKDQTRLIEPTPYPGRKADSFDALLCRGVDIVSTHALFLNITVDTIRLIKDGGYTLILDESLDVFKDYNDMVKNYNGKDKQNDKSMDKATVEWLINKELIAVDTNFRVTWNDEENYKFKFSEVVKMAQDGVLYCIDNALFWIFDPLIFTAFDNVYILTYQHEGTLFDSYMKMNRLEYTTKSVTQNGAGQYFICDYYEDTQARLEIGKLIQVYEGNDKADYNEIGARANSLSISNLSSRTREEVQEIKNCMKKYKRSKGVGNSEIMWTTSKSNGCFKKLNVRPFKYTKNNITKEEAEKQPKEILCFVPCNARGTNDYSNRTTLLYILNRYLNPEIQKYFRSEGFPIDEDRFALNELLQWVFRSAVRNGQRINLYVPSKRMRYLLYDWLGVTTPVPHDLSKTRSYAVSRELSLKKKQGKFSKKGGAK